MIIPFRNSTNVPLAHVGEIKYGRDVRSNLPFNGNIQVCKIVQDKVDKFLVLFLAEPLDERQ